MLFYYVCIAAIVQLFHLTTAMAEHQSDVKGEYKCASTYESTFTSPAPDSRDIWDFMGSANMTGLQHNLQQPIGSNQGTKMSGVTIKPVSHSASSVDYYRIGMSADEILSQVHNKKRGQLVQSSFQNGTNDPFYPDSNGFVNAAIKAYSRHHHLKIRPEDVWLAILTQLSSYINAHAEELRGSFVAHEGKKELEIRYDFGTRFTVDWGDFASKIGIMIQDNVVDPELREWMMPAFSTTTEQDTVIASIVMMASMQSYFEYMMTITCGLPSVTLLGEKADYELILRRLNKLRCYGEEPTQFADLLTPVLKRFIQSFEDPEGEEVKDFWNRIVASWSIGSGMDYYSGWITAFIFWDEEGKAFDKRSRWWEKEDGVEPLLLDGVTYHTVSIKDVPPGFCTVPVKVDDNGDKIMAEMLAGSVGVDCTASGDEAAGQGKPDTLQARSGWWVYETGTW